LKNRRVALVFAVIFTALAVLGLWLAVSTIVGSFYRPQFESAAGSGGIGAVSFGAAEAIVESLPLIAVALFVNFSVAAEARQRGRAAARFRRAHLFVIVLTIALPLLETTAFFAVFVSEQSAPDELLWRLDGLALAGAVVGAVLAATHLAFALFAIKLLRAASTGSAL
jgi:hypothetical protein